MQESHNLIIDIGNSRTKFYLGSQVYFNLGELENALKSNFNGKKVNYLLVSTNLRLNQDIELLVDQILDKHNIEKQRFNIDGQGYIKNSYPTLGKDRIAKAIGVKEMYPKENIALVDFGTATTLNLIDKENNFLGGMISPGIKLCLQALKQDTAQLPDVQVNFNELITEGISFEELKEKINKSENSTIKAILLGSLMQVQGFVNNSLAFAQEKFAGESFKTICTGGQAFIFKNDFDELIPDLEILNASLSAISKQDTINAT